jgi:DNA-3-methyladenine glycosylase I
MDAHAGNSTALVATRPFVTCSRLRAPFWRASGHHATVRDVFAPPRAVLARFWSSGDRKRRTPCEFRPNAFDVVATRPNRAAAILRGVIDERPRCWWAGSAATADPLMVEYHDSEWGVPVNDEADLFERLALESFQAGLSWSTILRKREAFRSAFRGFRPEVVAAFMPDDVDRLMGDASIVRNRAKILATIGNAKAFAETSAAFGSFDAYLATIVERPPRRLPPTATGADIPATTAASDALSRDLRRRGFRFVGSTIVYAFMQSVGLVDDHLPGCWRYAVQPVIAG